jgi:peptidoglycan/LPS O-acetylase OafA/YrhL
MNDRKENFSSLDGFRFISIVLVLLHHIVMCFPALPAAETKIAYLFYRLCVLGFLGVDFFFVISGFLIAGLLIEDLEGNIRVKRFYLRRAFKILPQYVFVVLVGMIFTLLSQQFYPPITYISYFAMFQNYAFPIGILGHLWSIAVEEHFYVVLPVIFWIVSLLSKDVRIRKISLVVCFIVLIVLCNWIRYVCFQGLGPEDVNVPKNWQYTHLRFDGLLFGCLLRFVYPFFMKTQKRMVTGRSVLFILGLFIFVFLFNVFVKIRWWDYTLAYMASGFLIMSGALGFRPLCLVLENQWVKYMGRCSYGIYLWHYLLIGAFADLSVRFGFKWIVGLYAVTACLVGIAATKTIEDTFLKLRRRLVP